MKRTARKTGEQKDMDRFRKRLLKNTRKAFKLRPKLDNPHILDVASLGRQ